LNVKPNPRLLNHKFLDCLNGPVGAARGHHDHFADFDSVQPLVHHGPQNLGNIGFFVVGGDPHTALNQLGWLNNNSHAQSNLFLSNSD
jgi:hypothetical protein